MTRDIAQRFNSLYGDTFVVPGTSLPAVGARVMGLDDPEQKMSKSATGANHAVALLDPPDKIRKTIMRATTDSNPAVDFAGAGPGVLNLLSIYQAFSGATDDEMKAKFTGMRYGDLKKQVAEMVVTHLEPFQQRYRRDPVGPGLSGRSAARRRGARRADRQRHRRTGEAADGTLHVAGGRMLRSYLRLLRENRNYRLLWFAQVVSELGDWFYALAVYNLLLELTGNRAQAVGLAVVLQVLPHTLVAPATGVINDRISRKAIMIGADVARFFIVLGMLAVRTPRDGLAGLPAAVSRNHRRRVLRAGAQRGDPQHRAGVGRAARRMRWPRSRGRSASRSAPRWEAWSRCCSGATRCSC